MAERSRTKYIILGMLSSEPASGYDITQNIKNSTNYFWSESEGQIYPTLAKCVSEGLATCVEDTKNNSRLKKIYTITKDGLKVLNEWLSKPAQESLVRNEFLLKLFFAKNISQELVIKHLENFISKRQDELESFDKINKELRQIKDENQPFWLATLNYGLTCTQAELDWAKNTLSTFQTL